jgi:hypothetical protein
MKPSFWMMVVALVLFSPIACKQEKVRPIKKVRTIAAKPSGKRSLRKVMPRITKKHTQNNAWKNLDCSKFYPGITAKSKTWRILSQVQRNLPIVLASIQSVLVKKNLTDVSADLRLASQKYASHDKKLYTSYRAKSLIKAIAEIASKHLQKGSKLHHLSMCTIKQHTAVYARLNTVYSLFQIGSVNIHSPKEDKKANEVLLRSFEGHCKHRHSNFAVFTSKYCTGQRRKNFKVGSKYKALQKICGKLMLETYYHMKGKAVNGKSTTALIHCLGYVEYLKRYGVKSI